MPGLLSPRFRARGAPAPLDDGRERLEGRSEVARRDGSRRSARRHGLPERRQRGALAERGDLAAHPPGREVGQHLAIHVRSEREPAQVNVQDGERLLPRQRPELDHVLEAPGREKRGIQQIGPARGSDHDHRARAGQALDLGQELGHGAVAHPRLAGRAPGRGEGVEDVLQDRPAVEPGGPPEDDRGEPLVLRRERRDLPREIVGDRLARVTRPQKLTKGKAGQPGVLELRVAGAAALFSVLGAVFGINIFGKIVWPTP